MTRDQMLSDLYERLTSRKLWMALLSIAFAGWNYHLGALTAEQFQTAVMVAATAYLGAEGLADAAAALRPSPPDVNVTPPDQVPGPLLTPSQRRQIVADLKAELMATPAEGRG